MSRHSAALAFQKLQRGGVWSKGESRLALASEYRPSSSPSSPSFAFFPTPVVTSVSAARSSLNIFVSRAAPPSFLAVFFRRREVGRVASGSSSPLCLGSHATKRLAFPAEELFCGVQSRTFSSGMRNTKAGIKNPFWRKRGFWEWRRREITGLNRRMRSRKHIFPLRDVKYLPESHSALQAPISAQSRDSFFESEGEDVSVSRDAEREQGRHALPHWHAKRRVFNNFFFGSDDNEEYKEDLSYLAPPKKGGGRVWVARKPDVPMGRKKLLLLLRLIKGLQLTDALDWLHALALHRCNVLINILTKEQQRIRDAGADPARVYIESYIIGRAGHVKTMQVRYHYRVSFLRSFRHSISILLRELPLHEFFHKTFVLKQVPRSLTHDMRLALAQQTLPAEVGRDWAPFLDAPSRYSHKQRLRLLHRRRLFNYFLARRAFEATYLSHLRRRAEEEAAARGTSLRAVEKILGRKRQTKCLDLPEV